MKKEKKNNTNSINKIYLLKFLFQFFKKLFCCLKR